MQNNIPDDRDRDVTGTPLSDDDAARRAAPPADAVPPRRRAVIPPTAHRRSRAGWLLPVALLALVVFGLSRFFGRDRDDAVAANPNAGVTTSAAGGDVSGDLAGSTTPVAQLISAPRSWQDKTVSVHGTVAEVVSDRGFWVEDQGQRMFVVLGEKGAGTNAAEHAVDIKSGQAVTLNSAHVYTQASQVPGGHVQEKARAAIKGQRAFLHVLPNDVQQGGA